MKLPDLNPQSWAFKLGALLFAAGLVGSILGGIYLSGRAAGVGAEKPRRIAAEQQTAVTSRAARAVETAVVRERTVRATEARSEVRLRAAPGAAAPIPSDVATAWASEIDGIRNLSGEGAK